MSTTRKMGFGPHWNCGATPYSEGHAARCSHKRWAKYCESEQDTTIPQITWLNTFTDVDSQTDKSISLSLVHFNSPIESLLCLPKNYPNYICVTSAVFPVKIFKIYFTIIKSYWLANLISLWMLAFPVAFGNLIQRWHLLSLYYTSW